MKHTLPATIKTPKDIVNFFNFLLHVESINFHPDDAFEHYGHTEDGVWVRAYTKRQAALRDKLMTQAFDVANAYDLDIYCMGMWANVAYYGEDPASGPEDCDKEKAFFIKPVKHPLDWWPR